MPRSIRKIASCPRLTTLFEDGHCFCGQECNDFDDDTPVYCSPHCARSDALASLLAKEGQTRREAILANARAASSIRHASQAAKQLPIARSRFSANAWTTDYEADPHPEVMVSNDGQSFSHKSPFQKHSLNGHNGSATQLDIKQDATGSFNDLGRSIKRRSSLGSISSVTFPSMLDENDELRLEIAALEERFRRNRNSYDDSDDDSSSDFGYEAPVGWGQPSVFLDLHQMKVPPQLGKEEMETSPSLVHLIHQDDGYYLNCEKRKSEKAQTRTKDWILQDESSRQREYNRCASACASNILVATPTSPTLSLKRLIGSSIFTRKTNKKAFPKGISNLDEPWSSEDEDKRSASASDTTLSPSKWLQSSQKSKAISPLLRQRAYTSHHTFDLHPILVK